MTLSATAGSRATQRAGRPTFAMVLDTLPPPFAADAPIRIRTGIAPRISALMLLGSLVTVWLELACAPLAASLRLCLGLESAGFALLLWRWQNAAPRWLLNIDRRLGLARTSDGALLQLRDAVWISPVLSVLRMEDKGRTLRLPVLCRGQEPGEYRRLLAALRHGGGRSDSGADA